MGVVLYIKARDPYYCALMSKAPLPNKVDPRRSAEQGISFSDCYLPLNRLNRLTSYLVETDGEIDVSLQFGLDEQRIRYLTGTADINVKMLCQRCLESVEIPLNAEMNLGIVKDEEAAKNLPRYYDPLIVDTDYFDPASAVEEELILTLPLMPVHENCQVQMEFGEASADAEAENKENPFSILAQLKGKNH